MMGNSLLYNVTERGKVVPPDCPNSQHFQYCGMCWKMQYKLCWQSIFCTYHLYQVLRFDRWNQINDHGTSHISIVDSERNAVSMTNTVNSYFGAQILSPSTGIVLNNEMDDFSMPGNNTGHVPPPAPLNLIRPGKRPLSSMTPTIVLKVCCFVISFAQVIIDPIFTLFGGSRWPIMISNILKA